MSHVGPRQALMEHRFSRRSPNDFWIRRGQPSIVFCRSSRHASENRFGSPRVFRSVTRPYEDNRDFLAVTKQILHLCSLGRRGAKILLAPATVNEHGNDGSPQPSFLLLLNGHCECSNCRNIDHNLTDSLHQLSEGGRLLVRHSLSRTPGPASDHGQGVVCHNSLRCSALRQTSSPAAACDRLRHAR